MFAHSFESDFFFIVVGFVLIPICWLQNCQLLLTRFCILKHNGCCYCVKKKWFFFVSLSCVLIYRYWSNAISLSLFRVFEDRFENFFRNLKTWKVYLAFKIPDQSHLQQYKRWWKYIFRRLLHNRFLAKKTESNINLPWNSFSKICQSQPMLKQQLPSCIVTYSREHSLFSLWRAM